MAAQKAKYRPNQLREEIITKFKPALEAKSVAELRQWIRTQTSAEIHLFLKVANLDGYAAQKAILQEELRRREPVDYVTKILSWSRQQPFLAVAMVVALVLGGIAASRDDVCKLVHAPWLCSSSVVQSDETSTAEPPRSTDVIPSAKSDSEARTTSRSTERSIPIAGFTLSFEQGSTELTEESVAILDELGNALDSEKLRPFRFLITGYAKTSEGSRDYLLHLSLQRAQTIKNYLVARYAIDPDRLDVIGLGDLRPIGTTDPNEGMVVTITNTGKR